MAQVDELHSFYTSDRWVRFRRLLIAERGCVCEKCGKVIIDPLDLIAHHKVELTLANYKDASISLNPDNIMLVCRSCHNEIHHRFGFNTTSYHPRKEVYIIYGPPCSGKSSYVRQSMERGDIVVDMDRLYAAVSGLPMFDKPDNLYRTVMAMHDALIDNIKTRYGKWYTAYVVGGYPDKHKREALVDELGAKLIFCNIGKDECLARLKADRTRDYDKWSGYISDWFERYAV